MAASEERVELQDRRLRLDPTGRPGAKPVMNLVGGPHPYVWIGDEESGACYATTELSAEALRFFAALQKGTDHE